MDKDDDRLYISYEANSQLYALKKRFKYMTKAEIVEMLIKDRFSVSDQHKNAERRDKAWREYWDTFEKFPLPMDMLDLKKAFMLGYKLGWLHFQTRHGEDKFIIEIEPE